MKKRVFAYPLIFASICALAYAVAFRSAWSASDVPTLILVFCAALGSGAMVVFRGPNRSQLRWLYTAAAVLAPPIAFEVIQIDGVHPLWHRVVWGLMLLGITMAYLFDRLFMKESRSKNGDS